ncbi:MAG TPA: hypothetical protein VL495_08220 [Edaphobacter sp.]|jgi:hypothetical protein|nr:hypothetical protein [Edaphobacter sp.]
MHSSRLAEWMVRRFTSPAKAATLVGDLEELRPQKGSLWFWSSLAMFVARLCWRWLVALIVVSYLATRIFGELTFVVARAIARHRPQPSWMTVLLAALEIDAFLWITSIFAAIRYGIRDRGAQLAFLWAGLVMAVVVSWSQLPAFLFSIGLCGVLMVVSIKNQENRRRMCVLAVTVEIGFVSYLIVTLFEVVLFRISDFHGILGIQGNSNIFWFASLLPLVSTWAAVSVFSRMHRWALNIKGGRSEVEIS